MAGADWPARDLLAHRVETTPDATAIVDADRGEEWTYRDLDRRVGAVAARLEAVLGAETSPAEREPARIGVLMDTRPAVAEVYFAAMRRGHAVVALSTRETATELASKARRTDVDVVVCEATTEPLALDVVDELAEDAADELAEDALDEPSLGVAGVVSVDEPERDAVGALRPWDGTPEATADPVALDADREHLIMFTSGTSGTPKAVRLTVANLVASATASAFRLGVLPSDRWLCCLPTYHMGGLAPLVRSTLYGTTTVMQRSFDPGSTADVIEDEGVTGVSLVPTMCKRLLDDGWTPPDALRFALLGGAPASRALIDRCDARGVPVHPTYGMTETASQITTATPEEAFSHPGTSGRPLACTDVTVVDDAGDPVDPGESGEIVVSGPTVTPGYLDDAHTEDAVTDRGLRTGDVGRRDEDGRLWVLNRRSDRIVTGGENVDPGEVVDALRAHPRVDAATVVGLPDEEWGERVAALVVPADEGRTDAGPPDVRALRAHCRERLAGFKCPKTIGVADALPRTLSGTVDREAVREHLVETGMDATSDR